MSASPNILRWVEIDTTEFVIAAWSMSVEQIGAAWLIIAEAAAAGCEPDLANEDVAALWTAMKAKQRTGRRSLPPALRAFVIERDGEVCRYCGDTEGPFEVDHLHPVSRGGTDDPENLGVACGGCNRAKGPKLISEWLS